MELRHKGKVSEVTECAHLRKHWVVLRCDRRDKILDIGSANGWIFSDTNLNVTHCDINEFDIPNFVCADAHDLPFEDNSFDICCLDEILEHVNDPVQVLKEAVRVCSKKVIFTVPNEWDWSPDYKPLMKVGERLKELGGISVKEMYLQDNPLCTKCNDAEAVYHHRWYNRETLTADIEQCHFPYKLEVLNYEGWSHFIGEIYKDEKLALNKEELKGGFSPPLIIKKDMPSPNALGYIKYDTLPQPKSLHLDIYAYCNAKCLFCRYPTLKREKGTMDMGLLERILDDASTWATPLKEIVPIHFGEFFLLPNWYEILELIEKKLPKTNIILPTNGSKLDYETISKLATIQSLSVINISVNAFFNETYEAVMGLQPEVMSDIKKAINYLQVLAPHINIWCSMVYDPMYQTEKEKELFIKEWREYGHVQVHPASFIGGDRTLVSPVIPCRSIFIDFIILWDGRVVPCCWDSDGDIVVGNVNKQKILDVWHGKKMNNLRKAHNEGRRQELTLCSKCSFS